MIEIYNMSDEERSNLMQCLLEKYVSSKSPKQRNTKWKDEAFVTRVIKEHVRYLTIDRNIGIEDDESIITEQDAFKYLDLYNTKRRPNLNKLMEILTILDKEKTIGAENANKICKSFGKIAESSVERLRMQIRIINKFNYMNMMLESPQKFSISPEYLYARLAYYAEKNGDISTIPAQRVLADKDEYTRNERKKVTVRRKEELIQIYPLSLLDDEKEHIIEGEEK